MLSDCERWGCSLLSRCTRGASFLYEGDLLLRGDSGREQSGMFPPEARIQPVGLQRDGRRQKTISGMEGSRSGWI